MNVQVISVKQLRENLPKIREGLKKDRVYLLIYRSQPFAKLEPLETDLGLELEEIFPKKADFSLVDKLAGGLRLGKDLTPAKINKILDQRYEKMLS